MKRYYVVQIAIDASIVVLGLFLLFFPEVVNRGANISLFILMSVYAGLELLEYLLGGRVLESLYLFLSSGVCAFSGFFLRGYPWSNVLSVSLLVWIIMISIIKIIALKDTLEKKRKLFIVKLALLSAMTMMGILIATDIYFKISRVNAMLATFFLSYGLLEMTSDMLDYLKDDIKLLKE